MKENRTDKTLLIIGLKKMGIALILMFLGPTTIHFALINQEKPLYIFILILGIIGCIAAIFLAFLGIKTIMNSLFNKN